MAASNEDIHETLLTSHRRTTTKFISSKTNAATTDLLQSADIARKIAKFKCIY